MSAKTKKKTAEESRKKSPTSRQSHAPAGKNSHTAAKPKNPVDSDKKSKKVNSVQEKPERNILSEKQAPSILEPKIHNPDSVEIVDIPARSEETPKIEIIPEQEGVQENEAANGEVKGHKEDSTPDIQKEFHERKDLVGELEALLFAAGKPMGIDTLAILTGSRKNAVRKALQSLKESYERKGGALFLIDEGENWKFSVKERHLSVVSKIVSDMELSKSLLETLAVIAWKTPIMQAELVKARSTKIYDHVPELERLGFVVREKTGRSFQLRVTQKFFDYFELDSEHHIKQVLKDSHEKAIAKQAEAELKKKEADALKTEQTPLADPAQNFFSQAGSERTMEIFGEQEKQEATSEKAEEDEDTESFLKGIDDKIEKIAKSHGEIVMRPEQGLPGADSATAGEGASVPTASKDAEKPLQKKEFLTGKKKIMADLMAMKGKTRKLSALRKKK